MSKRILWLSKHKPLDSQRDELKKLYGKDCEIIIDLEPFRGVEDIADRIEVCAADDIVLMAPLSMMRKLLDLGIQPLYAEMRRTLLSRAEVIKTRRDGTRPGYEFVKFMRLTGIEVNYEDVTPDLTTP
jgi:hypothetical protein